jgi:hypothetical protein
MQLSAALDTVRKMKGRQVVYYPGDTLNDPITIYDAVVGALKTFHRDQQVVEARDFLIKASVLVDRDGNQVVPVAGHRIHEEQDGLLRIYEVAAEEDQPFWRWSDPSNTTRRIHTIFIKSERL